MLMLGRSLGLRMSKIFFRYFSCNFFVSRCTSELVSFSLDSSFYGIDIDSFCLFSSLRSLRYVRFFSVAEAGRALRFLLKLTCFVFFFIGFYSGIFVKNFFFLFYFDYNRLFLSSSLFFDWGFGEGVRDFSLLLRAVFWLIICFSLQIVCL